MKYEIVIPKGEPKRELNCPFDFTSRCTMGRCDCKPKQETRDAYNVSQERMYSEEEVWKLVNKLNQTLNIGSDLTLEEWFEQFKKK